MRLARLRNARLAAARGSTSSPGRKLAQVVMSSLRLRPESRSRNAMGAVTSNERPWFRALVRPSMTESLATFSRRIIST